MAELLSWQEVEAAMTAARGEDGGLAQADVASVFWTYEGRTLAGRDGRGARQTVNVMSFALHFGIHRNTLRRWLERYRHLIEPSAKETA